jgi:hypothetical protein
MDAQAQLRMIDIWSQWDLAFGEHANELRYYFTAHLDTLHTLMLHMLSSRGQRPTKKWLREWQDLKQTIPAPLLRPLLMGLAAKKEWYIGPASLDDIKVLQALERGEPVAPSIMHPHSSISVYGSSAYDYTTLRGWHKHGDIWYERFSGKRATRTRKIAQAACWALVDFPDAQVRDLLMDIMRAKLRKPALWTMAQWGDNNAVARLLQLTRLTRQQKLHHDIAETLRLIADQQNISVEQLKDRAILHHGLNAQGVHTWSVGADTVRLSISASGRVQRGIKCAGGKSYRKLPSELYATHETAWQAATHEARSLAITLSTQKKRLETAMRERRSWSWEAWQCSFALHPVSGHLARRLVWAISTSDGTHLAYAIYNKQDNWQTADGAEVQVTNEHYLHIIHPVEMQPEDHSRWQRYIVQNKISQPFKQMFRESYLLTPAEEETRTYSNRFASHIVSQNQPNALNRVQGWRSSYRVCWCDFPQYNMRAYFWCGYNNRHTYTATTEQIAFYPIEHSMLWTRPRLDLDPACLPLHNVPPHIFSEVMRDIDQCVISASQGTDQHWEAEDQPRYQHHPEQSQPPHQREQMLRELIPLLDLDETIQIEGRCAYISGSRCLYKVDLGNGTIYTEPGGRYLCIVPRYNTQKLYLPFEESDPKTSEILSKILLLSHDETITDTTILRQLPKM